ncbi:hypothetical protein [Asinibacterium sp. OR53]|uniref:hypothetical protein n=1 Tax=Asinibacterium sp. OR53 TaxID=925409 RepID=UPI0004AD1DAF|nr:hypothetical protein [Asinibacterium sp. OR53]
MKLKKLLFSLPFLLCINALSAQPPSTCNCNCSGLQMPRMIINDNVRSSGREANFRNIKRKFLMSNFPQEFPLNYGDLKEIFKKAVDNNASGLRIYFAQEANKSCELSLVFVPTMLDLSGQGLYSDQPGAYQKIEYGLNEARLNPLKDTGDILANFRDEFKKKSESDVAMTANGRQETISLFYSKDNIKQLYDTLETGCLKGIVHGVGVRFVAYEPDEKITGPDGLKPVGNQLLIHFIFYDCKNKPIDFVKCYNTKRIIGDTDTGLPCPDFCNGGAGSRKK